MFVHVVHLLMGLSTNAIDTKLAKTVQTSYKPETVWLFLH